MASRWIVGAGPFLDAVVDTWQQALPDESLQRLEIPMREDHTFDIEPLQRIDGDNRGAFVAFDERFGNFRRMELMRAAMERGLRLEPFVHPTALVARNASIAANAFIGPYAVIGHGCQIGYNSVVLAGVQIGHGTRIKPSCWIEGGVQVCAHVEVESHCTIRAGTVLQRGIKVGRGCELGWPQAYAHDIPARTVFDPRYDAPIHVYGQ
ncbi:UDP-3-O-(3-hydroxymyristoyl)glucosamine N-acyltransferase [Xanthomonas nasturtii]|uniref:UDP-3-O-(3-hydroxymyristoyl)glucosamine N-acyltransferase n=1 Tax=Xanthomonas nasturtii TaxID=1843581 RepID=UPI002B22B943|nr:UDP-3-O-(3-hydroxymyristoyl)glucosamine N-acyltransferase [Xanthomonas nasturtii]MEA9578547.1 UDP-3-O-(3-hydroxymyristoyl)glucosamine N-acyltransferase [Xanthomonas nasturtii]